MIIIVAEVVAELAVVWLNANRADMRIYPFDSSSTISPFGLVPHNFYQNVCTTKKLKQSAMRSGLIPQ